MLKRGTSAYDETEADAALDCTIAYPANAKQKFSSQMLAAWLVCLNSYW